MKKSYMTDWLRLNVICDETVDLQARSSTTPANSALSLLGILSLDWNFWPFLGIFGEVWKCVK